MSREYYMKDPALREYFLSLSPQVQAAVATQAPELDLGELQLWAGHYAAAAEDPDEGEASPAETPGRPR